MAGEARDLRDEVDKERAATEAKGAAAK